MVISTSLANKDTEQRWMVWRRLSALKVNFLDTFHQTHRGQNLPLRSNWKLSVFIYDSAALQPLSGKLYTYLSAKRTFLFFVAIFELGSLLCGVATSSTFFILGRTVAGLGTSGLENGALTLIAGAVPLQRRPCKSHTNISSLAMLEGC
jgi:MFS family permease